MTAGTATVGCVGPTLLLRMLLLLLKDVLSYFHDTAASFFWS